MAQLLSENRKKQLDGIVAKMTQDGRSQNEIQFVVDDFKKLYGTGVGGKLVRDIATTPARLGQNVASAFRIGGGQSFNEATAPRNTDFLGPISPVGVQGQRELEQMKARGISPTGRDIAQSFKQDVGQSVGAGLEMASYLPFARGATAATVPLKGLATRQGAIQVLKSSLPIAAESAIGSGLYTAGQGIGEGLPAGEVARQTAGATAFGGATGLGLGVAIPATGAFARSSFKGIKNIGNNAERIRGVVSSTPSRNLQQREIRALEMDYEKLFDEKKSTIKKNDILSRFGETPAKIFAEAGYIPKIQGNKIRTDDFIDSATDFIGENAQSIQKVLDSYEQINPSSAVTFKDFRRKVISQLESDPQFAGKVDQIVNKLDTFLNDYKKSIGKEELGVGQLNKLRVQSNINTKAYKFTDPEKPIIQDLDSQIGNAVRNIMREKNISPTINQINEQIGKLIKARDMARYINGNTINGGALTKMAASMMAAEATLAVTTGGMSGVSRVILSLITALGVRSVLDALATLRFGGPIRRQILKDIGLNRELRNKLLQELPEIKRKGLMREIQSVLKETPQLEAPKAGAPRSRIESGQTINLPARTNTAIEQATKNMGQQKAFGAFAGIEQDENGNITFNPEKAAMGLVAMGAITSKQGDEFVKAFKQATKEVVYKGEKDLTTKILKDLEGKTTVSKQYIQDLAGVDSKTGLPKEMLPVGVKLPESKVFADILKNEGDKVNVANFAQKVKAELLPLTSKPATQKNYDYVVLKENRGNVKSYEERLYESPIKTSAGETGHYPEAKNYFGHTRIEDMADNKTRRVIEVQSDLYQKGNLEREMPSDYGYSAPEITRALSPEDAQKYQEALRVNRESNVVLSSTKFTEAEKQPIREAREMIDKLESKAVKVINEKRANELKPLQQYNDPTAHFRMIREEIKKASQDGKTKLQFPTGETAMKIEGLGENHSFMRPDGRGFISPQQLEIGLEVKDRNGGNDWIITDVLGDGKFKAVPRDILISRENDFSGDINNLIKQLKDNNIFPESSVETFDISGKVDTNNPIYKFYNKEMRNYLKNKYNGYEITDDNGVTWIQVDLNKEIGRLPVEAFGLAPLLIPNKDEKRN